MLVTKWPTKKAEQIGDSATRSSCRQPKPTKVFIIFNPSQPGEQPRDDSHHVHCSVATDYGITKESTWQTQVKLWRVKEGVTYANNDGPGRRQ